MAGYCGKVGRLTPISIIKQPSINRAKYLVMASNYIPLNIQNIYIFNNNYLYN